VERRLDVERGAEEATDEEQDEDDRRREGDDISNYFT